MHVLTSALCYIPAHSTNLYCKIQGCW